MYMLEYSELFVRMEFHELCLTLFSWTGDVCTFYDDLVADE